MKRIAAILACAVFAVATSARAQVANIKVVTDANPDYSDMESMVHSITANWKTDAEKMWALFYWDHIGKRHTVAAHRHGFEITDPIRQFNDYGYAFFTTIAGIKCSEWDYMGYPSRQIGMYPEVWYDGGWHLYDNAYNLIYSLADGKTIASAADIIKTQAGPETGGKPVHAYLGLYHCLTSTGPRSYPQGADYDHPLSDIMQNIGGDVRPNLLQQRGHRYILNLRPGEVYTRYYHREDEASAHAVILDNEQSEYRADPAAFVHMGTNAQDMPADAESNAPSFRLRGSGERTFSPILDAAHLAGATYSTSNVKPLSPGLQQANVNKPGEAIFKVEGSNVITSFKLRALASVATADDSVTVALSTDNGMHWKQIWKTSKPGDNVADFQTVDDVNGVYDFLVKVTLAAKQKPQDAQLKFIGFNAWTQINSKTQPKLNLGANTVYVGVGEQTNSIVLDPELQNGAYKPLAVGEENIKVAGNHWGMFPVLSAQDQKQPADVVFKVDAPTDITSFTFGGRFALGEKAHIDLFHSFDGGKTWKKSDTVSDGRVRADVIRYQRITDVPPNVRSVQFKYVMAPGDAANPHNDAAIYAVHMEVHHKLAAPLTTPIEVTFNWREINKDRSLTKRSHTQLVEKLPTTYEIHVGGADHPIVDSLVVSLKGTRSDQTYGYSGGVDPATQDSEAGRKWVGTWETVGKDLALGKPYTLSIPSGDNWGAGDPNHTRLTDGIVGQSFGGGNAYGNGAIWSPNTKPEITVDLGSPQNCAAFRIHILGYPSWDAVKGEIEDNVDVLTSVDGKNYQPVGSFNFKLFKKDIPLNFMMPDTEALHAYNFVLPLATPVEARYVKYRLKPQRMMGVTEVQVLDNYKLTPFSLNIALPDPSTNGKAPPKPDISPNAKQFARGELPAGS
jgi:hypothetical protein